MYFWILLFAVGYLIFRFLRSNVSDGTVTSVNYHISRRCNYACGFCFHTAKTSSILKLNEAIEGVNLLHQAGMKKLNFAGGEPLLYPKFVGELAKYCKTVLGLESVSIVTNGSKLKESWFQKYGAFIDVLALSCDSFDETVNIKIGRAEGKKACQTNYAYKAAKICADYGIKFKINTVVNAYNWREDMCKHIAALKPKRWKVFQVLPLEGENKGCGALRDVDPFLVTKSQFDEFVKRHNVHKEVLVAESNELMQNSYLILDENMCFLNCSQGGKTPSKSILDVGVKQALRQAGFDNQTFVDRGGVYEWSRDQDIEDLS